MTCNLHLDYTGEVCRDCQEKVDEFGNTESNFKYCSFPKCGCDGARLCMAGKANDNALDCNVEGMWNQNDKKSIKAREKLLSLIETKASEDKEIEG